MIPELSIAHLIQDKRVLHFGPEKEISKLLIASSDKYVSADFSRSDVDLQIDICNMNNIPDGSFDLVVVCDVLEHVSNDSAALLELHRILDLDAWAIITVPQKDNLVSKYEDFSLTTAEDRKKAFGRGDHLRIYGNDFGQFLESHGFKVKIIDESNFSNDTVRRHVLCPPILSTHPLATNFRKVYFAKKSIASK